ncbi:MAG: hypothetical protein KIS87_01705 [Phycisphaeraceae bacterium]|nr:hypothetical protein [Phycisphaeraceae bacterium]
MQPLIVELIRLVREHVGTASMLLALMVAAFSFLFVHPTLAMPAAVAMSIGVGCAIALCCLLLGRGVAWWRRRRERRELGEHLRNQEEHAARELEQVQHLIEDLDVFEFVTFLSYALDESALRISSVPLHAAERKDLVRKKRIYNTLGRPAPEYQWVPTQRAEGFLRSPLGQGLIAAAREFCQQYRERRRMPEDAMRFGGTRDLHYSDEPVVAGDLFSRAGEILRERGFT